MDESTRGTLFGVSVGPGDPELMTLKAVRIVRAADVVAVPDTGRGPGKAYHIAREYIAGKGLLTCATPMTRDPAATAAAHRKAADAICAFLDAGKDVAYLCLGDVSVYSSYHYVHRLVVERGYDAQIVPGVTPFCAAAARAGVPPWPRAQNRWRQWATRGWKPPFRGFPFLPVLRSDRCLAVRFRD